MEQSKIIDTLETYHGATQDLARGELVGVAGRVSSQLIGFVGMSLVHPNGSERPWVPWCGYSVLTSAECVLNLSIATSSVMGTVRTRSHNSINTHMTE